MIKVVLIITTLFLYLISPDKIFAQESKLENRFITIVNPVRVSAYTKNLRESFEDQYQEVFKRNLPATWLLTFDVLEKADVISGIKGIDKSQELGLFLEVTPGYAEKSGVAFNKTDSWHRSTSVFLSGYKQEDRIKLINIAFEKFKAVFGYYPKSVGAWWIDSYSLSYMQKKYGIVTNLGLADQFAMDGYQVWGQYWSTPFIPSINHAGIPAKSLENKINLVTLEWAPRDPLNGYGQKLASLYSSQDYFTTNQNHDYFSKLLDIYLNNNFNEFGQITIGLEGDFDPFGYSQTYATQLDIAQTKNAKFVTMSEFATWYLNKFPLSPAQIIVNDDILGTPRKVIWYQSPNYRLGLKVDNNTNESQVFDFRIYTSDFEEPYNLSPNKQLNLYINLPSAIDTVSYPESGWLISTNKFLQVNKHGEGFEVNFTNQSIKFTKDRIILSGISMIPTHIKSNPLVKIKNSSPEVTLIPKSNYPYPLGGQVKRGLSIEVYYFLNRPKVQMILKFSPFITILISIIFIKLRLHTKIKTRIWVVFLLLFIAFGISFYYFNSQNYLVSQSEADALLHLKALPKGKVIVYNGGCLICTWHTKYPPPAFGNNRSYVQSISKKPIIYDSKIFTAKTREEGRQQLKKLSAKYIYLSKFEEYQESLPFSPGDYFIDLVYENANAQVWKIRDGAF